MEKEPSTPPLDVIDFRLAGLRLRLRELIDEVNNLAIRVHQLEDHFDAGGTVEQLTEGLLQLALAIERVKDGSERP